MDEKKQGILNMAKNDLLLHYVLSTDQMTLKCYEKDVMYFFIDYSIEEGEGVVTERSCI